MCLGRAEYPAKNLSIQGGIVRSRAAGREADAFEHTSPDTAAVAEPVNQLEGILATESPEQAKDLLRLLVKEIRVHERR